MNDIVNGLFELVGSILVWTNVYKLHKDKKISGIFWPVTAFFATWGFWNLYYYPSLGQMWSFYGGLILVVGNTIWVIMAVYYKRNNQ